MPFTGSHPAAVLPFLGTPLPASALVIGSMAPDFPYYLPFQPALYTHTALSIVTTDLLLGALAWAIWHGLLAAPAVSAAPRTLRARLTGVPLGLSSRLSGTRTVRKLDMVLNNAMPHLEVDPETYEVCADGVLLTCEPATVLPMAQRYFLF